MGNNFGIRRQLQDKRKKKRRVRFFLYYFLAALFYSVFFSGYFAIRHISFFGTEAIAENDARKAMDVIMDESALFWSYKRNIFLFSAASAERVLQKNFPRIETVHIVKKFFQRAITATITERQPAGITCGKTENAPCFYFDKNGIVFDSAPIITGATVLLVKDDGLPPPSALPLAHYTKSAIIFMQDAKQAAYDIAGVTIASYSFLNEYGDIEAVTLNGYTILFTMERDFSPQVRVVKNLLTLEIKERVSKLDYIDLRVENRAYYKLKE